jgi:hypothetical protein
MKGKREVDARRAKLYRRGRRHPDELRNVARASGARNAVERLLGTSIDAAICPSHVAMRGAS